MSNRDGDESSPGEFAVREAPAGSDLDGCFVELRADGSVVLVVDGERLFRFESFEELLAHYELFKGGRWSSEAAGADLRDAELAVAAHVAAIHVRPRAEKALADERVVRAIERVRLARDRSLRAKDPAVE